MFFRYENHRGRGVQTSQALGHYSFRSQSTHCKCRHERHGLALRLLFRGYCKAVLVACSSTIQLCQSTATALQVPNPQGHTRTIVEEDQSLSLSLQPPIRMEMWEVICSPLFAGASEHLQNKNHRWPFSLVSQQVT